jgi:hypothetical protein
MRRLIDDSYVVNEPPRAARHLPRGRAEQWLDGHFDSVGVESTIDLQAVYM